jgi:hypothetical protein
MHHACDEFEKAVGRAHAWRPSTPDVLVFAIVLYIVAQVVRWAWHGFRVIGA